MEDKGKAIDFHEIKNNSDILMLFRAMIPEADLRSTPSCHELTAKRTRLTILNFTNKLITFDAERFLKIENRSVAEFNEYDCKIIAYHLNFHPEMICVEQKDDITEDVAHRIYFSLQESGFWEEVKDVNFRNSCEQDSLFKTKVFTLWKRACVELPLDIMKIILDLLFQSDSKNIELVPQKEVVDGAI